MGSLISSYSRQEYLHFYLRTNQPQQFAILLAEKPNLISRPITKCHSPPLLVAVRTDRPSLVEFVLSKGADPKGRDGRKRDALMTSVLTDCPNTREYIIQKMEFDREARCLDGFSALDYAIVMCNMKAALQLLPFFKASIKSVEQYQHYAQKNKILHINYNRFIECLLIHQNIYCSICNWSKNPLTYEDPVIDPRESWIDFMLRVSGRRSPPIVERTQLQEDQLPENRCLGNFYQRMSGINSIRSRNFQLSLNRENNFSESEISSLSGK